MRGALHPLLQYAFMAWCSVKAQGQLYTLPTFYLTSDTQTAIHSQKTCYIATL